MQERKRFILNTLNLIWFIILYYIVGSKSIFLYVLSLSLYNIFLSCFNHISIKESFNKIITTKSEEKIFKYLLLIITVISFLFLLLSILISDITSVFLKINNILPIFILMAITIINKPLIRLLTEYLENVKSNHKYLNLITIYEIIEKILLLIFALFSFRIFKLNIISSISLMYFSKIVSLLIIIYFIYKTRNAGKNNYTLGEDKINYKKEIKKILTNNSHKSMIDMVKNSYYYISIIILYIILNTRYHYQIDEIEKIITFIYFYAFGIIYYLIYLAKSVTEKLPKDALVTDKLYQSFQMMLTIAIIFGIISPLTCKVIFNDPSKSIYLTMINFLAIFILLYDMTYENIKNKKIIYISLFTGLIIKIVLIVPLINSFYRMGYSLIYGDVLSTAIAMFISIIINYIYLQNKNKKKDNYFEKILNILYENIILAIILIVVQFIIPMDTKNYFKSLVLIIIYLIISIAFIKIKNKKRG